MAYESIGHTAQPSGNVWSTTISTNPVPVTIRPEPGERLEVGWALHALRDAVAAATEKEGV